jgi:aminoglycoside phosphotransferase family enzyme/predicted kinase
MPDRYHPPQPASGADVADQKQLIETLAAALRRQGIAVQLIETHISWVLLASDVAYKFKKALRLDFLDYSTLEARRFYCEEEIRLNRRLARELYLAVVSINGPPAEPVIGGPGLVLEHAVKMRAFAQTALWDYRLQHDVIAAQEVDLLAHQLARFHHCAARAPAASVWGTPDSIATRSAKDMSVIAALLAPGAQLQIADDVAAWQTQQHATLGAVFTRRKALGWIRECHGDLHSGNIVTTENGVAVFDCIEFNDDLRWIDVLHDLAFVWMDLQWRGRSDLAARLLNLYLQRGGDYAGLAVLRYYSVQRALVRCKVALLRSTQPDAAADAVNEAQSYLAFASAALTPARSAIIIAHGFSGSGKSTLCVRLVELLGAVQVRSDIERKRVYRIAAGKIAANIYTPRASSAIYLRLRRLAARIAAAGLPVIIDAAFLQYAQRRQFEQLAQTLGLPFFILDVHANPATLRARISAREREGSDPSDATLAVLEHQLATHEPLGSDELPHVIAIDTERAFDLAQLHIICAALAH